MINSYFPALTNRNYFIFWSGQFLSLIGSFMQATVQPYLAYRITDQPIYLGYVGFAATLPGLLFVIPGGVIVERANKKRLLIFLQTVMLFQALTLSYLTLTNQITITHILVLAFLLGLANSLEITTRQSFYFDLVGKDLLPNAIALNSTAFNAARVIGPLLAVPFLLISDNGEGYAFLANAISYLFVLISLFLIKPATNKFGPVLTGIKFTDLSAGPKYILQTPFVLALIAMIAFTGFFGLPFMQFIPVVARDLLRNLGDTADIVAARNSALIAFMGIGALFTGILLAINTSINRNAAILKIGQIFFVLALLGLGFSKNMQQAVPMMVAYGSGFVIQLTITNTMIQLAVPDSIRGRVLSVYIWVNQSTAPFGALFIGWMIQQLGPSVTLKVSGLLCLIGFITLRRIFPSVRSFDTGE